MPESQNVIERLAVSTQINIRSTQILTSLPQIVSELVQNSLDASASHIEVGLDHKEWMCWVRDDGHGINKDDLENIGQGEDGGRYKTSKTYASASSNASTTFGFRGEALASAADMSCLEICSRTAKSRNTWSVILKGSKALYFGPAVRWKRESPGTTVCVRDAFFNLPVRRLSHPSNSKTWDLIRQEIETYSLVFPHVSFTLEDTSRVQDSSSRKDRVVRIAKSGSTITAFRHLFGQALTEHLEEINSTSELMRIEGFISLTGASSKMYQFLYINRHPISTCDLHRLIDTQFAASSFSKNALDEEGENDLPRSTIRRSPRKNEKKPVYVLNIFLSPEDVDNCVDPAKNTVQVRNTCNLSSLLSSVVESFLAKHGFVTPRQDLTHSFSSSPSPRKRRKFQDQYNSGHPDLSSIDEMSTLSMQDEHHVSVEVAPASWFTSMGDESEEVVFIDASECGKELVNSQTGTLFRPAEAFRGPSENNSHNTSVYREAGRRTLAQRNSNNLVIGDPEPSPIPPWLELALQGNQTYALTGSTIPFAKVSPAFDHEPTPNDRPRTDQYGCHTSQNQLLSRHFRPKHIASGNNNVGLRFTKEDLRHATIINQIDRKFIVCCITKPSLPNNHTAVQSLLGSPVLVLIDQHAADERVRVERFLKELCLGLLQHSQHQSDDGLRSSVLTMELTPPRPVLLTQHEARTIKRSQDVQKTFRKWGIRFAELPKVMLDSDCASEAGSNTGYLQLLVSTIPEVVGNKLLQGDELRDFIKGFLGQIQNGELLLDSRLDTPSEDDWDEFTWLKAMRGCPRGLLDLINSKACRGAIMFNDTLSIPQCSKLVKQLSETTFPFQCAHGRPSLVPLTGTGVLLSYPGRRSRPQNDWTKLETIGDL
ncbi:hypothetical protein B0H34DRAFT_689642 [Crassisporium funariophilum]|nr:hypothetical protein B0H34DRAFT_689642 [Crassisporium funariophilum]